MKILVSGATGFLGKNLVQHLLMRKYSVLGLGRNEQQGALLKSWGAKFQKSDLSQSEILKDSCHNVDAVIHCAALSAPWGSYSDHYNINVLGTKNLLKAAMEQQVARFIHISSPSIYFKYCDQYNIRENSDLKHPKVNHYATSKYLAELEVEKYRKLGLQTIILRPRAIFGPGDEAIIPRVIKAQRLGFFPIFRRKDILMDITYVDNVSLGIIHSLNASDQSCQQVYNITNDEPIIITDFLQKFFAKIQMSFKPRYIPYSIGRSSARLIESLYRFLPHREPPITSYTVGLFTYSQTLNIENAKKNLAYSPNVSLAEAIDRYGNWYLKQSAKGRQAWRPH